MIYARIFLESEFLYFIMLFSSLDEMVEIYEERHEDGGAFRAQVDKIKRTALYTSCAICIFCAFCAFGAFGALNA